MKEKEITQALGRRGFVKLVGLGVGAGLIGMQQACKAGKQMAQPAIQGFEDTGTNAASSKVWVPVSDRKIRVGLVGYGVCKFSAAFGFQDHPNVEIELSVLFLALCSAGKSNKQQEDNPSLQELNRSIGSMAVFIATDAPVKADLCSEALKPGSSCSAVPAVFARLKSGKIYEQ